MIMLIIVCRMVIVCCIILYSQMIFISFIMVFILYNILHLIIPITIRYHYQYLLLNHVKYSSYG